MAYNENEEKKELMTPYPNVRRVMVSAQTFTLEEIHQAIQEWIKSLRGSGDIASLARIKYATMNPDTAQATLIKLVKLAIGQCANERIKNDAMTNINWPISFTQDLLGLLTAVDYEISAIEEPVEMTKIKTQSRDDLGKAVWDTLRKPERNPAFFRNFKHLREFEELDENTKEEFNVLGVELLIVLDTSNDPDNYEF